MTDFERKFHLVMQPIYTLFFEEAVFGLKQLLLRTYGELAQLEHRYDRTKQTRLITVTHRGFNDWLLYPVRVDQYFYLHETLPTYQHKLLELCAQCFPPCLTPHWCCRRLVVGDYDKIYQALYEAFEKVYAEELMLNDWIAMRNQWINTLKGVPVCHNSNSK